MHIERIKKAIWQLVISKDFIKKLKHNFSDLTLSEKIVYLLFIRPFYKDKFFFEGNIRINGQVNREERRALYQALIDLKAKNFFEIGTWKGGGSTYFAAMAFHKLGAGTVYTSENYKKFYEIAINSYRKFAPHLLTSIKFLFSNNINDFLPYLEKEHFTDCVFLDGSDNPMETVDQYKFFSKFMKSGSLLMCHDWNSMKMSALKPLIIADKNWKLKTELGLPVSNGFVIYEKI